MSVFTTVTSEQLECWLRDYPLGDLLDLQGIASGITNTNYFVTTASGRYVLTLFEKNSADELPFFLNLMTHLSERGVPSPHPVIRHDGHSLGELNGKPAALVSCLLGRSLETPTALHCAELGRVMAGMHVAGLSFPLETINPRDQTWRQNTAAQVADFLPDEDRELLVQELAYQANLNLEVLPRGVIHADLFRDNVLFAGDILTGLIDFYYACDDILLYDLAIAANDWCISIDGSLDPQRLHALLSAYHSVRPVQQAEAEAWPDLLRIAALRFWLSRLYDLHYPQAGELTHAKDPQHFQRILANRIRHRHDIALNAL